MSFCRVGIPTCRARDPSEFWRVRVVTFRSGSLSESWPYPLPKKLKVCHYPEWQKAQFYAACPHGHGDFWNDVFDVKVKVTVYNHIKSACRIQFHFLPLYLQFILPGSYLFWMSLKTLASNIFMGSFTCRDFLFPSSAKSWLVNQTNYMDSISA